MAEENQKQNHPALPLKPQLFFKELSERPAIDFKLNPKNWFGYKKLENGDLFIEWFKHFSFLVKSGGLSITCFCNGENLQVSTYLWTQVFSFALLEQGFESLHGTQISKDDITLAFIGDCGRGKSTLASHFISKGWQLIGDDLIVFNRTGFTESTPNTLYCYPGDPYLKLQPRIMNRYFADAENTVVLNRFTKKKIIAFTPHSFTPRPLTRIFYINRPNKNMSIRKLTKLESFWVLNENVFNTVDFNQARKKVLFTWLTEINARANVSELNYPRNFKILDQLEDQIYSVL